MPTVTSKVDAFMTAVADGLALRAGLDGVQVTSGWVSDPQRESIQLVDAEMTQTWGAIGNTRREEEFTVTAVVWVVVPGKGEAVIRECRGRAFELLAEVEDYLRVAVRGNGDPVLREIVRAFELEGAVLEQGANQEGRWCQLTFRVHANKDLRSS